jgi:hypothetical protein
MTTNNCPAAETLDDLVVQLMGQADAVEHDDLGVIPFNKRSSLFTVSLSREGRFLPPRASAPVLDG